MSGLPFDDLLPATFKGARTLRALTALVAAALLAACGTNNGGYSQDITSCSHSALGCNYAPANYGFAAGQAIPHKPGFYSIQPAPYQPLRSDSTPSASSNWIAPSASAAETSPRREPDPPVAVDNGDKCGWWRLCNVWSGQ